MAWMPPSRPSATSAMTAGATSAAGSASRVAISPRRGATIRARGAGTARTPTLEATGAIAALRTTVLARGRARTDRVVAETATADMASVWRALMRRAAFGSRVQVADDG